jgi:hypothetical protein
MATNLKPEALTSVFLCDLCGEIDREPRIEEEEE